MKLLCITPYPRLAILFFTLVGTVATSQAQPLPERHSLRGRVVQSDGKPVVGASISLHRTDYADGEGAIHAFHGGVVSTDAHGYFNFDDAETGSYYMEVSADNYAAASQTVDLAAESQPLTVTMYRLTTLNLRFLKPDGSRLGEAFVSAYLRGPNMQRLPPLRTDAQGAASVASLIPGEYALQAVCTGVGAALVDHIKLHEDNTDVLEVKMQPGGVLKATALEAIQDKPGKPLGGAIFTLERLSPQTEVVDPAQGARFGGDAMLYASHLDRANLISHEGTGQIQIEDVLPGRYAVSCYLFDYNPPTTQLVTIAAGAVGAVSFELKPRMPLAALDVTVQDGEHHPVRNTELWLQLRPVSDSGVGTGLPAADGPPPPPDVPPEIAFLFPGGTVHRATTDAMGKLTLYPIRPGRWHVTLLAPRNLATESRGVVLGSGEVTVKAPGGQLTIATPKAPSDSAGN